MCGNHAIACQHVAVVVGDIIICILFLGLAGLAIIRQKLNASLEGEQMPAIRTELFASWPPVSMSFQNSSVV